MFEWVVQPPGQGAGVRDARVFSGVSGTQSVSRPAGVTDSCATVAGCVLRTDTSRGPAEPAPLQGLRESFQFWHALLHSLQSAARPQNPEHFRLGGHIMPPRWPPMNLSKTD